MRIKVIERALPVNDVFEVIVNVFEQEYKVSEESQVINDAFFIFVLTPKSNVVIIQGAKNDEDMRFYISVDAIKLKALNQSSDKKNKSKIIENYLNELIIKLKVSDSVDPFKKNDLKKFKRAKTKKNLVILEREILNKILERFTEKFEYHDDLMQFPFSVIDIDGSWEEWKELYRPYLKELESNMIEYGDQKIKTYENYDFSLAGEFYQRLFDLIAVEQLEIHEKLDDSAEGEKKQKTSKTWINFFYAHKKSRAMKLMKLMKLTEEVRKYIGTVNRNIKSEDIEFRARLILISLYGFEKNVKRYLRENINQEKKYIIPIFIIPPINEEIWHNFRGNFELTRAEESAKNEAKHYIRIHQQNSQIHSYINFKVQEAKERYNQLIKREKTSKKVSKFLEKWSKILNLESLHKFINLNEIKQNN
jgi:hypothetical protein